MAVRVWGIFDCEGQIWTIENDGKFLLTSRLNFFP